MPAPLLVQPPQQPPRELLPPQLQLRCLHRRKATALGSVVRMQPRRKLRILSTIPLTPSPTLPRHCRLQQTMCLCPLLLRFPLLFLLLLLLLLLRPLLCLILDLLLCRLPQYQHPLAFAPLELRRPLLPALQPERLL